MDKVYYAPKGTIDWHELGEPISGVNVISEEPTTDWSPNASLSFTIMGASIKPFKSKQMLPNPWKKSIKLPRKLKKRVKAYLHTYLDFVRIVTIETKPKTLREFYYNCYWILKHNYGKHWPH